MDCCWRNELLGWDLVGKKPVSHFFSYLDLHSINYFGHLH